MNWFFERLAEPLVLFGFAGQFVFMLRFVVQWLASERRKRSYVPIAFWYISIAGGFMLFLYGLLDRDPVIMVGQFLGLTIYFRNLLLIYRRRWRYRKRLGERRPATTDAATRSSGQRTVGTPLE